VNRVAISLLKRLGATVLMLLGAVIGTFLLTHVVPADPAQIAAGLNATPAQVAQVRADLGLDKPLLVQLGIFLADLFHGDLGTSFISQRNVSTDIATFFPATFELVLWAIILMVVLGVPIGLYSALGRSRAAANTIRFFSYSVMGVPAFVIALVSQIVFFGVLGWFPSGGRITGNAPAHITGLYTFDALLTGNWAALGSALLHLALPAASLAIYRVGMIARYTESEVQRVMHSEYIRTARAKGARLPRILLRHTARNATMPIITIVGMEFGWLLGGSVLVESIFSWPGMGQYILTSVASFDFSPVIISTLVLAAAFAAINFIVDILQNLLDPRVREA
jgi:peptide/nickel transport system permease protein